MEVVVAAVDVGSLANIGWWRAQGDVGEGGKDLDALVTHLVADLRAGSGVAIGFEAPLFIPRPSAASGLNKQRLGEHGHPWCAGAGTGALALGIQQATYLLSAISARVHRPLGVGFDPSALLAGAAELVVWEAFVSGKAKNPSSADPHIADARSAVLEFQRRAATGVVASDVEDVNVLNLAGAALLAAGLTDKTALLTEPCVVVRAPDYIASSG